MTMSNSVIKPWYGPIIVMKLSGSKRSGYKDAGNRDFLTLLTYFLSSGRPDYHDLQGGGSQQQD
ncbi:hypothetical protein VKT23_010451 [Stygiomarasmius scandens]|uniref:Uncharacterized protein n=1 Tax=Marasmiellus scandens TaxID=2682957 RepID=A0ABR1JCK1_9AGAR